MERKQVSEEVLAKAERAKQAVIMYHRDGCWVDANPAPAYYTKARWEMMRSHFGDLLTPEQWEEFELVWGATGCVIVEGEK